MNPFGNRILKIFLVRVVFLKKGKKLIFFNVLRLQTAITLQ